MRGVDEVIELVLSWAVTTALAFTAVIADERRMTEGRLERAWPTTSRNAAIVAFGILALPFHFAKTRGDFRSARGVLGIAFGAALGVIVTALVALVSTLVLAAVGWALGWPEG